MYKTIFNHMGMFVKEDGPFCDAPLRTLPHELGSNQQSLKFHKKNYKYYCTLWTCALFSVFGAHVCVSASVLGACVYDWFSLPLMHVWVCVCVCFCFRLGY